MDEVQRENSASASALFSERVRAGTGTLSSIPETMRQESSKSSAGTGSVENEEKSSGRFSNLEKGWSVSLLHYEETANVKRQLDCFRRQLLFRYKGYADFRAGTERFRAENSL